MKVFSVTPEILELFRNEKVSAKTVKQLIPNYLEYQIKKNKILKTICLGNAQEKLYKFLSSSNFMTAQDWLDGIESILDSEGLLIENSQEVFCFDGEPLDEGYGMAIYETDEKLHIETETNLLERLCSEIRLAKKNEKLELKNIEITTSMLNKIANDPILMNKLLELKEFKNV